MIDTQSRAFKNGSEGSVSEVWGESNLRTTNLPRYSSTVRVFLKLLLLPYLILCKRALQAPGRPSPSPFAIFDCPKRI